MIKTPCNLLKSRILILSSIEDSKFSKVVYYTCTMTDWKPKAQNKHKV